MTGPSLDLDALREKAEKALILLGRGAIEGSPTWCEVQDVLALIDEQRAENERLQGVLREIATRKHGAYVCALMADRAIAGSPAENKEPS